MENSKRKRYKQSPEKNDYFLDPNQTLTKEKIQEAFAKTKLLDYQNIIQYEKENINLNIIPPKKNKNENNKMDIEVIEIKQSNELIASTSTKYSNNNSKLSIESNNNQISYETNLIFYPAKNNISNSSINIFPKKNF